MSLLDVSAFPCSSVCGATSAQQQLTTTEGGSSQSDTESIVSPTAALKTDLEVVEAQLRVLAERRARVEAELLHVTCGETYLRMQQRRFSYGIFAAKHGEPRDAAAEPLGPSPLRFVFSLQVGHSFPFSGSCPKAEHAPKTPSRSSPPLVLTTPISRLVSSGFVLLFTGTRAGSTPRPAKRQQVKDEPPAKRAGTCSFSGTRMGLHTYVWPCTWVRKTPAARKPRNA